MDDPEHHAHIFDPLHPRLKSVEHEVARLLRIDDPTECAAAMEEIQVLLVRCKYHVRGRLTAQDWRRQRAATNTKEHFSKVHARRGRPAGSANIAARQLGLGLAQIWSDHGCRPPRRRSGVLDGREYGPYRNFVQLIVNTVPRSLLSRSKGNVPEVDYLVREGIAEFWKAQTAPEQYRRLGLIDEGRWLTIDHKLRSLMGRE